MGGIWWKDTAGKKTSKFTAGTAHSSMKTLRKLWTWISPSSWLTWGGGAIRCCSQELPLCFQMCLNNWSVCWYLFQCPGRSWQLKGISNICFLNIFSNTELENIIILQPTICALPFLCEAQPSSSKFSKAMCSLDWKPGFLHNENTHRMRKQFDENRYWKMICLSCVLVLERKMETLLIFHDLSLAVPNTAKDEDGRSPGYLLVVSCP